jgi:hypothetical protein
VLSAFCIFCSPCFVRHRSNCSCAVLRCVACRTRVWCGLRGAEELAWCRAADPADTYLHLQLVALSRLSVHLMLLVLRW